MASDILPYGGMGGGLGRRDGRQLGRNLSRLEARGLVRKQEIRQRAELERETLDATAYVTRVAMHEVAGLTRLEAQLCGVVPEAAERLQAIGDAATLSIGRIVTETAWRVRS